MITLKLTSNTNGYMGIVKVSSIESVIDMYKEYGISYEIVK